LKTWITLSVVALLPMLIRSPKALLPLRVSRQNPGHFAGLFRRYTIHTVTGIAGDAGKRSDTLTKGKVSSTLGADGQVSSVSGSVESQIVVTDRFFVTDARGEVTPFEGSGFDARVGNGHVVSLAWVLHGLRKSGPYILIYNHTTGEAFFNATAIRKRLTFPYPALYIALLCIMLLPIPVLIIFAVLEVWQKFRFERSGVRPLVDALHADAVPLMSRNASDKGAVPSAAASAGPDGNDRMLDPAASLREMAALRDSGAISEAEFETAKTKILRQRW
jgi:hypothetical protein